MMCPNMSDEKIFTYGIYDRQIRLFGEDTQKLIENSLVCVIQGILHNLKEKRVVDIGGEMLKNFILLGVRRVFVDRLVEESFTRIFPGDVNKINENVEIKVVDYFEEKPCKYYDFAVFIDCMYKTNFYTGVYVCSGCMSFHDIKKEHRCENITSEEPGFAHDCILGAILVQEWIKKLQGKRCVNEYQLKL